MWHLVRHRKRLRKYLPAEDMDAGEYPARKFFWGVAFAILPEWAKEYYDAVI